MSKAKTISKVRTVSKEKTLSKQQYKLDKYFSEKVGSQTYDKNFRKSINELDRQMKNEDEIKQAYEIHKTRKDYRPIQNKFRELEKNKEKQDEIVKKIDRYESQTQTDFTQNQLNNNKKKLDQLKQQESKIIDYLDKKDGWEKRKSYNRKIKSFNGHLSEESTEVRMSQSHKGNYQVPKMEDVNKIKPKLERDRKRIKSISDSIKPTEVIYIKRRKSKNNWKPYRVELYGITSDELRKLAENSYKNNELVKINSIHGAFHSLAMTEELERNKMDYDFAFYSHVPIEFEGEKDYIKYYSRYIYKKPLVITNIEEEPEVIFERKGAFPTDMKRWCVKEFKLHPLKAFLKEYFGESIPENEQVVVLQYLGIQAYHSPERAEMNPKPIISDLSTEKTIVYQAMPVFDLSKDETKQLIKSGERRMNKNIIENCNECEFNRHGCITCSYAGWRYYQHLKENYPEDYEYVVKLRDASSKRGMEKAKKEGEAKGLSEEEIQKMVAYKDYRVYQKDKTKLPKAMKEAGLTECPY